jgi:alanine dehydrogenase
VALRPAQVRALTQAGHRVWVETGAGAAIGFDDASYEAAGGRLVGQAEVYANATLLMKIKCPLPEEYGFLCDGHILFTYLHFDENIPAPNIMKIIQTGVTGIAYEWVEEDGHFPLLQPMSELAGAVYARKAMNLLMERTGFLGGRYQPHWPASRAMVIGVGHIGANAVNVFLRNRFELTVVDKHPETLDARLRSYVPLDLWVAARPEVIAFDEEAKPDTSVAALRRRLPETDIVIGSAVRRPTLPKEKCEYLIARRDVASMRPGSVLCDATACDRDFFETATSSDSLTETYMEEGVIHYNCDHIASLVAHTATLLLTEATFPYVQRLTGGFTEAVRQNAALAKGVMCYRGHVTHAYSARKKNLAHTDLAQLL